MNKKTLPLLFLFAALASLVSACNTIHGAGKDIERAGEKIQDTTHR